MNEAQSAPPSPAKALFANRSFRLLLTGSAISMLGDQFTLVAMPWLVLKLSGDSLALGTVLATIALPQAVFILLGGAVVDRFDARRVLLVARSINAVLIAVLCALVATGLIRLWMVYGIALGIGLATAFVFPAGASILPRMLEPRLMPAANGVLMSLRQFNLFLGPLLAGRAHRALPRARRRQAPHRRCARYRRRLRLRRALTFVASIVSAHHPHSAAAGAGAAAAQRLHSMAEGSRACGVTWRCAHISVRVADRAVRGRPCRSACRCSPMRACIGARELRHADERARRRRAARHVLTGTGVLSTKGRLGIKLLSIDVVCGLLLAALALVQSTWVGASLLLVLGICGGFVQVAMFSWIQQRIPPERMGRTMGVVMFVFIGVAPLSAAGAGLALRHVTLTEMFVGTGLALTTIALLGSRVTGIRTLRAHTAPPVPR